MRSVILLCALCAPLTSQALTANEAAELSRAGVSDTVIIAQIEADGARARLSADTILRLQDEGVSDEVILALIRSGSRPAAVTAPPSLTAQRRALDHERAAARQSTFQVTTTPLYPPLYNPYGYGCLPPQPVPFQYVVGQQTPLFVNASPGVYGAPVTRPCAPRIEPCRPQHSGITIIVRARSDE